MEPRNASPTGLTGPSDQGLPLSCSCRIRDTRCKNWWSGDYKSCSWGDSGTLETGRGRGWRWWEERDKKVSQVAPSSLYPWRVSQRAPALLSSAFKVSKWVFFTWVWKLLKWLLLHWALWWVSLHANPLRPVSQFIIVLWVLDMRPIRFQTTHFGALKSWVVQFAGLSLCFSGRCFRVLSSLLIVGPYTGGGVYGGIGSQTLLSGLCLICPV